jgi:deoxyadenosine/deoxycytidine kinase
MTGKIVCIEGNIATGKTTFIQNLKKELEIKTNGRQDFKILEERIDYELLKLFNSDPKSYGYQFQRVMMHNRLETLELAGKMKKEGIMVIMDTGILRELAFSLANFQRSNMNQEEYNNHVSDFWTKFKNMEEIDIDHIVLLDSNPETCKNNIMIRNRLNEKNLEMGYLETLQKCHLEIFQDLKDKLTNTNFLKVDVSYKYLECESVLHLFN